MDWLKGVQWWPEDVAGYQLAADCGAEVVNHGDVGVPRPVVSQPFMVRTNVQGPKSTLIDLDERARRRLEFVTSTAVARELWLGEMAAAAPFMLPGGYDWSNPVGDGQDEYLSPHLTSGDGEMLDGAREPAEALAAVEDALGDVVSGGPLFLHVPLALVTQLGDILVRQGDLLTTVAGSVIIADRGYPGTGSGPGTWVYGTGTVMTWVGDAVVRDRPAQYVDVRTNHIEVWAERPAMTLFDPQTLVGCEVA